MITRRVTIQSLVCMNEMNDLLGQSQCSQVWDAARLSSIHDDMDTNAIETMY